MTTTLHTSQGATTVPTSDQMNALDRINAETPDMGADVPMDALRRLPDGFYWDTQGNRRVVRASPAAVQQLAADSAQITSRLDIADNSEERDMVKRRIPHVKGEYEERVAHGEFHAKEFRRMYIQGAAWNAASAVKALLDARSRAQYLAKEGKDAADDELVGTLRARGRTAARDAWILEKLCYESFGCLPTQEERQGAAQRVMDYSAKRLTEAYGAQPTQAEKTQRSNAATLAILDDELKTG